MKSISYMKNKLFYYLGRFEYWIPALWGSLIMVGIWVLGGLILASPWIDSLGWDVLKVLEKSDVLGYLQVLLAIQIPLFLLFIERMSNSGYINRKVLPQVTDFRTLLVMMMTGCTLVLISGREAYLYAPVVMLVALSLFAVYRAVAAVFQPTQFNRKIEKHLQRKISKSFEHMLKNRIRSNQFHERLEEFDYIHLSYFDRKAPKDMRIVELRTAEGGYLEDINLDLLARIYTKEFGNLSVASGINDEEKPKLRPEIKLRSYPALSMKKSTILAKVVVPKSYEDAGKMTKQMLRAFTLGGESGADIQWFDEMIEEFEQQLNLAASDENVLLLTQTFDLFQVLLDGVDEFIQSKQENGYSLESALKEQSHVLGDELSKRLRTILDIVSNLIAKSLRDDQTDISRELVDFIYRNLISSERSRNLNSIARYERLLGYGLYQFILPNSWNKSPTSTQLEVRRDFVKYLRDHTDTLRYELKELDEVEQDASTPANPLPTVLGEWFNNRISSVRGLAMAAFRNDRQDMFDSFVDILLRADEEHRGLEKGYDLWVRCNMFMLAAYAYHEKNGLTGYYGQALLRALKHWDGNALTVVTLECVTKNYADAWNIDTYGQAADGEMYTVPNYEDVIRGLWARLMLEKTGIVDAPEYYSDRSTLELTTFFTDGQDDDRSNTLLKIINDQKDANVPELEKLVRKFIKIRRDWENTKLTEEKVDPAKLKKFEEAVTKAYRERSLVARLGPFIRESPQEPRTKDFMWAGINQIFDKQAFIKEWHSDYSTDYMAQQLGESIASDQDKHIFSKIFKRAQKIINPKSLPQYRISKWLVISNGVSQWNIQRQLAEFIDEKKSDYKDVYFKKIYQVLPIQLLSIDELPEGVYFVDVKALGKLKVKDSTPDMPVKVDIAAFSHSKKLMKELIDQPPEWLAKEGDASAQAAFLNKKVRLLVARVFKYVPARPATRSFYIEISSKISLEKPKQ